MRVEGGEVGELAGPRQTVEEIARRLLRIEHTGDAQPQHLDQRLVKPPGRQQDVGFPGRQQSGFGRCRQHRVGLGRDDRGMIGGVDQLQRLGDELHVDEAARRLLQVPGALAALGLLHHRPHLQHVGDDALLLVRPRDDGGDLSGRARDQPLVTGDRAGAGERHVLPRPRRGLLIGGEGVDVGGERPRLAGRPEAKVDGVEGPLGGRCGKRRQQPLGQPGEILGRSERALAVGGGRLLVEIVKEDKVEVGGGGHFAAAEAAEGDERHFAAGQSAVRGGEFAAHGLKQHCHQRVGEVGVGMAGLAHADGAGEHAHTDQERLLLAEDAGAVEHVLEGTGLGERRGEQLGQHRLVGKPFEEGRLDHRIEDVGARDHRLGETRRGGEDRRQKVEEIGIGLKQGEELDAGRHAGEEAVEGDKRRVGVVGRRQRLDQHRHELGQPLARARRAGCRVAAVVPVADRAGDLGRMAVAELREGGEGVGVVGVAGEDETAGGGGQRRRLLEQVGVAIANGVEGRDQRAREGAGVAVAGHARDGRQPLVV